MQPPGDAVRAFGSAIGVTILSLFGAAWIFLPLLSRHSAPVLYVPPVLLMLLLVCGGTIAVRKNAAAARSSMDPGFRRKIGRVFGIVNAVEWTLVLIATTLLGRYGLSWLIVPVIVIIVGLHLLPLARLFERNLFYVAGAALVAWAATMALALPATLAPVITAIGTGILLWITAAILLFQTGIF